MDYEANVKLIILGYMNGAGGDSLDVLGVLLGLPNGRNLTRSFSRHQEVVGEKIRKIAQREMDLALEMELNVTIIHEEGDAFYETWAKSERMTRKKFGLVVSYDMG